MTKAKLDELILRLSNALHGEEMVDVMIVCARVIAFAINEAYDDDDEKFKAANRLIKFLKDELESMMQDPREMSKH